VTGPTAPPPLRVEDMTDRQLQRRARLLEAVIEIVGDVGPGALQMREVAERSGVALGTAYRYFRSREHLLATALAQWQEQLTRRVATTAAAADADPAALVSSYVRPALRAFSRNPQMAALMVQMQTSGDPDVVAALSRMGASSAAMMDRLLVSVPAEALPHVERGIDSVLMNSVTAMVTGRATLEEATARVEGVARLLLAGSLGGG
jgi:AcrR family transcriptional regulator